MVNWGAARELAETAGAIVKELRAPDEALSRELLTPGPAKLAHSAAETFVPQRIDAAVSPKAPAQDSRAFFLSSGDTPKKPGIFGDSPASPAIVSRDTIPVSLTEGNLVTLARNMYRETRTWEDLTGAHKQASYGDKYLKGTWDYLLHPGTGIPFDVVQDPTKASQVRDTLSHIPQIIPAIDRFRGELSYVRHGLSLLQREAANRLEVAGSIWNPISKSIGLPQVELKAPKVFPWDAAYMNGKMLFGPSVMLKGGEAVPMKFGHEADHLQNQFLRAGYYADEMKIGMTASPEQLEELAGKIYTSPSVAARFIDARQGRPLSRDAADLAKATIEAIPAMYSAKEIVRVERSLGNVKLLGHLSEDIPGFGTAFANRLLDEQSGKRLVRDLYGSQAVNEQYPLLHQRFERLFPHGAMPWQEPVALQHARDVLVDARQKATQALDAWEKAYSAHREEQLSDKTEQIIQDAIRRM